MARSPIDRLLKRHHWRQVVPRPDYPQKNPKRQEGFKKTPRASESHHQEKAMGPRTSSFWRLGGGSIGPHPSPQEIMVSSEGSTSRSQTGGESVRVRRSFRMP